MNIIFPKTTSLNTDDMTSTMWSDIYTDFCQSDKKVDFTLDSFSNQFSNLR